MEIHVTEQAIIGIASERQETLIFSNGHLRPHSRDSIKKEPTNTPRSV